MKKLGSIIQALYVVSSLSLAIFCLLQSNRVSHDQRARDLATKSIHLDVLQETVDSGLTPAERMLALYRGAWRGDVRPAYTAYRL